MFRSSCRVFFMITSVLALGVTPATAQVVLSENFDTVTGGIPTSTAGWVNANNSDSPSTTTYFQGNPTVFPAQSGATNSYIGVNYQSTAGIVGTETISNWLITPVVTGISDGMTFSFYTRTVNSPSFPDRLEVRMNTTNTGTNLGGTTPSDVGDFSTVLLTINPNLNTSDYPNTWTNYTATVSGVPTPTDGRFAFRYFVTNAGPNGTNSDYIGIDTLVITAVPEPGCLLAFGALGVLAIRRRRSA